MMFVMELPCPGEYIFAVVGELCDDTRAANTALIRRGRSAPLHSMWKNDERM